MAFYRVNFAINTSFEGYRAPSKGKPIIIEGVNDSEHDADETIARAVDIHAQSEIKQACVTINEHARGVSILLEQDSLFKGPNRLFL